MEDDFKYFCKLKATSNIFVNIVENGRGPSTIFKNGNWPKIFVSLEEDLTYVFLSERGPKIVFKWKITLNWNMEDNLEY